MNIAIIEDGTVVNIVVGQPNTVAELFDLTLPANQKDGDAWIGARWNGKKFEPQRRYESWTWNEKTFDYDPPKPRPEGNYYWSEAELDWLPVPEVDPETGLPVEPEVTETTAI